MSGWVSTRYLNDKMQRLVLVIERLYVLRQQALGSGNENPTPEMTALMAEREILMVEILKK